MKLYESKFSLYQPRNKCKIPEVVVVVVVNVGAVVVVVVVVVVGSPVEQVTSNGSCPQITVMMLVCDTAAE